MKNKITLSIEEMKHLESLGLDTSDASILYLGHNQFAMNEREDDLVSSGVASYVYTLSDILEKLPKTIPSINNTEYILEFCINELGHEGLSYYLWDYPSKNRYECIKYGGNGTMLDCAFNLLIWCIETNYIKTNK